MTLISFVVAVSKNGVIGRDGGLPWHISSDLKRFKEITMGKPVIMGRKTWESLPRRPLPGRRNIVITRQPGYVAEGADVVQSIGESLALCAQEPEVSVIGGGEIFALFWPLAHRLYLTEVDLEVDGDTHLPAVDEADWHEVSREVYPAGPKDAAPFTLRVLDRISPPKPF
ncbi:MAG TPA: dihydrofolate reductase [Aestuariivirga sp.]|nr:dihydrofolate reductase [Alphaproteobacteria bacterium]HRX37239.1 dihydrofolate reductase [Aestuariivirga sp.]